MDSETKIDLALDAMLREIEAGTLKRDTRLAYAVTYYSDGLMVHPAWRATVVDTHA